MTFLAHNEDAMVYSYKLNEDEWAELKKKSDLKLGCCGGRAVFKITKDGVRYFDHEKTEKNCDDSVDVSGEYLTTKSKHKMLTNLKNKSYFFIQMLFLLR